MYLNTFYIRMIIKDYFYLFKEIIVIYLFKIYLIHIKLLHYAIFNKHN